MLFLKKIIAACISNGITGKVLRVLFSNKVSIHGAKIDTNYAEIKNHVFSEIFFKLYESAEIRFLFKYVPPQTTVVELGSSIGVVSSILSVNKEPLQIFCIEANPNLINIINNNLELNSKLRYQVDNYLITSPDKSNGTAWFSFGNDNTTGKKSENKGDALVPTVSLSEYLSKNEIKDYVLISDIEGEESELLFNDPESLENCQMLIIELHNTNRQEGAVSVNDMKDQILELGFTILDSYGPNYVFVR